MSTHYRDREAGGCAGCVGCLAAMLIVVGIPALFIAGCVEVASRLAG